MTPFYQTFTELAPFSATSQNSLPLPLAAPIKVEGNINSDGLQAELTNLNKQLSASDTVAEGKQTLLQFDIGIDEVGRGPLYGSVVVSAAILPNKWSAEIEQNPLKDTPLSILTDSKKLSEVKRERLFDPIKQHALVYMMVEIPSAVIDDINILQATLLGMRLACEQAMINTVQALQPSIDSKAVDKLIFNLLIDGNKLPELDWPLLQQYSIGNDSDLLHSVNAEAWVKGDARHSAIAAASVLAKVSRDRQLVKEGEQYPGYGLEGHKGYPTKAHIEAIERLGVLPQHRRSFKPVQQALNAQR